MTGARKNVGNGAVGDGQVSPFDKYGDGASGLSRYTKRNEDFVLVVARPFWPWPDTGGTPVLRRGILRAEPLGRSQARLRFLLTVIRNGGSIEGEGDAILDGSFDRPHSNLLKRGPISAVTNRSHRR